MSLVVKVTSRCNSQCIYCTEHEVRGSRMSDALLGRLFERVGGLLRARPEVRIELQWHGGEPLLAGPDFFRRALALQGDQCRGSSGRLRHTMQSNLTLLSDELWEPLLALGLRSLGTSFDPEPGVRGRRHPHGSREYAERFLRGLGLVQRHRLDWGLIYVVTRRSLRRPRETFVFLTNLGPSLGLDLNPVVGAPDLELTPDEYGEFLGSVFPYWWQYRSRLGTVQPFSGLIGAREGGARAEPPAGRTLVILPDGAVVSSRSRAGNFSEPLGRLEESSLEELLARCAERERTWYESAEVDAGCRACWLWLECRGLRALDAFSHYEPLSSEGPWCHARKRFVEQWLEPALGIAAERPSA